MNKVDNKLSITQQRAGFSRLVTGNALKRISSMHANPSSISKSASKAVQRRPQTREISCRGLLDESVSGGEFLLPALGGILTIGGLGYLIYLYSQIEYITAAMISRHVPAAASVIQVGGGTKDLFYYPKSIDKVTVVGENVNKGLMEQGGVQAGCPTIVKDSSPADMRFAPASSIDSVVCIRAFSGLGSLTGEGFLLEAARVLKPGAQIVFIEQASSGIISALSNKEKMFEQVAYDSFLEGLYPHVAGVAIKRKDWQPKDQVSSKGSIKGF